MNVAVGLVGVVFGAMLFLSGMADYDVIHDGLLFRHPHLYLMMLATMATGIPTLWLLRRYRPRSLFGGPVAVTRDTFERKHLSGGLIFGTGWAIAGTCPGAVAAMAATGKPLALFVIIGIAIGGTLRDVQEERAAQQRSAAPSLRMPEPAAG